MSAKKKARPRFKPYRNAAPVARAPRGKEAELTVGQRLMYTIAGAGASTLAGSLSARQGWAPTTVALALGTAGAALAWAGKSKPLQTAGTGALAAAGGELGLLLSTERLSKAAADRQAAEAKKKAETKAAEDKRKADERAAAKTAEAAASKRPANAEAIPPEVMEAALERARHRLAMAER